MSEPTLAEIIRLAIDGRLLDVNVGCVGRVESFTPGPPGPPVADVVPVIRRALLDTEGNVVHEELPVIPNVPVIYLRGSGDLYYVTVPLVKGDHVQLVFNTQSFAQWRETGAISDPGDLRLHSLGNPVAIPGIGPKATTVTVDPLAMVIEGPLVKVGPAAVDWVANAELVWAELGKISTAIGGVGGTYTAPVNSALIGSTKLKAE
jgi:hypothetical protein